MARFLRLEGLDDQLADPAVVVRALALRGELGAAGLPWDVSVDEAAERYGASRWFDFLDVFRVEGLEVLGLPPTDWFHNLAPGGLTSGFYADLWLDPDERTSQAKVASAVSEQLGPGLDTGVSNTVATTWTIGFLEIVAYAFPRDLQTPTNNPLEDRHPELKTRTTVRVDAFIADPRPDQQLAARHDRARFRAPIPEGTTPSTPATQVRLHPSAVSGGASSLTIDDPEVWADDTGIAVSTGRLTAMLDDAVSARLCLEELTPARGGGQATLEVREADGRRLRLAWASRWDSLRPVARQLGEALGLELEVEQQPDE